MNATEFMEQYNKLASQPNTVSMSCFSEGVKNEPLIAREIEPDDFTFSPILNIENTPADLSTDDFADFSLPNFNSDGDNDKNNSQIRAVPSKSIENVSIQIVPAIQPNNIEEDLIEFLKQHGVSANVSNYVTKWNQLYNMRLATKTDCIRSYLGIHYCIFFDSDESLQMTCDIGLDFIKSLQFYRRALTKEDLLFIRGEWDKDYFNFDIINRYSNEPNLTPLILALLKDSKFNEDILSRFVDNTINLKCCMRLLLVDKLELSSFINATQQGVVVEYTEAKLVSEDDRFCKIRQRVDSLEIIELVNKLESQGLLVNNQVLLNYAEAFYLKTIIIADAYEYLNEDFALKYLMFDLGNYAFIARIYEKHEVDLEFSIDFMHAKLYTDLKSFALSSDNFDYEKHSIGLSCLICSRYGAKLSEVDYKHFLAAIALSSDDSILQRLDKMTSIIESYNGFWFSQLVEQLNFENSCINSNSLGENVLLLLNQKDSKHKFYLQIDEYVLNHDYFMSLVSPCKYIDVLSENAGIIISDKAINTEIKMKYRFNTRGSLLTWAKKKIPSDVFEQFAEYGTIFHSNLIYMILNADARYKKEKELNQVTQDSSYYLVNNSVLEFFKTTPEQYFTLDKMFSYVADSETFIGVLRSKKARELLLLFRNAYVYESESKMMYMFIYCILKKYFNDKLVLESTKLDLLDKNKSIILVDGYSPYTVCHNYRVFINSLDNFFEVVTKSEKVSLGISNNTISLHL